MAEILDPFHHIILVAHFFGMEGEDKRMSFAHRIEWLLLHAMVLKLTSGRRSTRNLGIRWWQDHMNHVLPLYGVVVEMTLLTSYFG